MAAAARAADPALSVVWEAQPRQAAFISCPVFEVFFGGARGGGKTDAVLGDFLEHADAYGKDAIGLMIRRTRIELVETIERSKVIYTPLGWTFHEQDKAWKAPNGARLRFSYLERDADANQYHGHSYTRVYVEEIGNFPSDGPILKLMATLRSGAGVPCGFRATGNPGGPGHGWVKARYITPASDGWRVFSDPVTGLQRVYIPSRVSDNKFLDQEQYVAQLRGSGSKELVKAWLEGDWDVVQGAFFDCWSHADHVIPPLAIPDDWLRYRSFDWGFASPFACYWVAVASDDYLPGPEPGVGLIPRGALVVYREWYGAGDKVGTGARILNEDIVSGIIEREGNEPIRFAVADPSMFAQQGGPSIAERYNEKLMLAKRAQFHKADNRKQAQVGFVGGWNEMRARLVGIDGRPMLYFFNTCVHAIRTIPSLQHDPDKPEDIQEGEDHAADAIRYACMARPWIPRKQAVPEPKHIFQAKVEPGGTVAKSNLTMNEIIKRLERQAKRRRYG